ncbi:MAG: putative deoxyguanosinetriphosphate triphosphohydrolase, partial [Polaromonas sp.]|nr:putative deoxyguanosinetriphosphate triphosphohydrolase [Polaromonas sp.]
MSNLYKKLLTTDRARKSTFSGRNLIIESESDRSRLVFSAPFRRLQQKAQVFSLEANAAVRSRLTHSLEVAQIGRFLADLIVENLIKNELIDSITARSFINFVETACLMHDLGNPPFGHFGEAAISQWFRKNGANYVQRSIGLSSEINITNEIKEVLADFLEFDGNCQGLRIVALLQWNDDEYGLNLTYTALASHLKYIRAPLFDPSNEKHRPFRKKAGFFSTEQELVEIMWRQFGYSKENPQRFPLAYVMEAADDIAYCISDLEDSIEKGLLKSE